MVVTPGGFQGLEITLNPLTHERQLGEIHRSSFHHGTLSRGNQSGIGCQIMIGVNLQFVIENRFREIAAEVPISMVHDIYRSGRISAGFDMKSELVLLGQPIAHHNIEIPRIAFLAIDGTIGQTHSFRSFSADSLPFPKRLIEPLLPAMQMTWNTARFVVGSQRVFSTIQSKFPARNTISKPSHGGTEK